MKPTPKPKVTWDGERFDVPDIQMNLWKTAFPALDIPHEIDKAAAWLVSNGQKKKLYARFLNGWLSRAKPDPKRKPAFEASESMTNDFLASIGKGERRAANE